MIKTKGGLIVGGSNFWGTDTTFIGSGAKKTLNQLIKSLFANNEQGFAYDPNDLTTMYQDAAGTIPVTGVGQAVGLILDKSKGLVLGPELLTNGNFSNGLVGWTANASSFIRPNSVVDGKAELEVIANASGNAGIQVILNTTVGKWYVSSCDVISHVDNSAFMWNETLRLGGTPVYGTGRSVLVFKATSSTTIIRCAVSLDNEVIGQKYYFSSVSVKEISGNHAYQTASASRPILRQNAVTGAYYLEFDGSDDFLQTDSIDFTATDEVSLFAGVRKLSDAATGVVCELSASSESSGKSFVLFAPAANGSNHYNFRSYGSSGSATGTLTTVNFPAPHSALLRATGKIETNTCELLINGGTKQSTSTSQGIGKYGNYPLYIGRRAGTALPFNGHLHSLIGIGRLTTDAETATLEKLIAKNTGVTLSV